MAAIEIFDHVYELRTEAVEPEPRERCAECGELGPGGRLFRFVTLRGTRERVHAGLFCSTDCHDIWHGLKRRGDRP